MDDFNDDYQNSNISLLINCDSSLRTTNYTIYLFNDGRELIENIEPWTFNNPLDEKHVKSIKEQLIEDPALMGVFTIIKLSNGKVYLLDGHHRFDYIKRKQIDNFIDVIIVSDSDVSINSHCSELLVSKNEFEKILVENNFIKDTQLPFFVSLDNCKYSNETINNIHELYSFKKNCLRNNIIKPLPNNQVISNEEIVNFTPITIKDIKNSKDLFPPKSTWITPRL